MLRLLVASDTTLWHWLVNFTMHGAQICHYYWSRLCLTHHFSIFLFQNYFVMPKHGGLISFSNSFHGGWIFRYHWQLVLNIFRSHTKKFWLAYFWAFFTYHWRKGCVKICNHSEAASSTLNIIWRIQKSFIGWDKLAKVFPSYKSQVSVLHDFVRW
jgi:hypothetical protein